METIDELKQKINTLDYEGKLNLMKYLVNSLEEQKKKKTSKKWKGMGSLHLGKKLDKVNLRDLAND